MLDLTTVHDHPATVLDQCEGPMFYVIAAAALRRYEQQNGVTFVALDNEALTAVRAAYEHTVAVEETPDFDNYALVSALDDLRLAVVDLLGLDD